MPAILDSWDFFFEVNSIGNYVKIKKAIFPDSL